MHSLTKHALAVCLVGIALPTIAYADVHDLPLGGDHPVGIPSVAQEAAESTEPGEAFLPPHLPAFPRRPHYKFSCHDAPGFEPGTIMIENDGVTIIPAGTTIVITIMPSAQTISFVLDVEMGLYTGMMFYDAYPAGLADVSCSMTISLPSLAT